VKSFSLSERIYLSHLLLSERTPLERCCVHNMSPFVSSSGLSPGSREANVQKAKVCINCTEPSVAIGLPAGRFQSGGTCRIHAAGLGGGPRKVNCEQWPKSRRHLLVTR